MRGGARRLDGAAGDDEHLRRRWSGRPPRLEPPEPDLKRRSPRLRTERRSRTLSESFSRPGACLRIRRSSGSLSRLPTSARRDPTPARWRRSERNQRTIRDTPTGRPGEASCGAREPRPRLESVRAQTVTRVPNEKGRGAPGGHEGAGTAGAEVADRDRRHDVAPRAHALAHLIRPSAVRPHPRHERRLALLASKSRARSSIGRAHPWHG